MGKDEVFREEIEKASDFKFGANVARVFDDMVNRSVPFYGEIQRMNAELAANHAAEGSFVYDLGCSTGTTMIGMNTMVAPGIRFIGVDDSQEMLDKCRSKFEEIGFTRPYELRCADLATDLKIENASVVVLCLTLQFVRPIFREKVVRTIYEGLNPGGVLILVERYWRKKASSTGISLIIIITISAGTTTVKWRSPRKGRPWRTYWSPISSAKTFPC